MAKIDVVTPEDLKQAVEDVKDDFRQQLHAFQQGHTALQEQLDRQAEELQRQPWSPQMENILRMIAAERKVNEDRFMRLGVNAAGGIAPSPFDLDQLMLSFEKKYELSAMADRLTKVEDRLDIGDENHRSLKKWLEVYFGIDADWTTSTLIDKIREVADEMTGRVQTLEQNAETLAGRVDNHDVEIDSLRSDVNIHTADIAALKKDVAEIKAQNAPISKTPLIGWPILCFLLGTLFGWIFWSWIGGAIVGIGLGILIGVLVIAFSGPKKPKAPKKSSGNPPANSH